jgi:hypothetical protein
MKQLRITDSSGDEIIVTRSVDNTYIEIQISPQAPYVGFEYINLERDMVTQLHQFLGEWLEKL